MSAAAHTPKPASDRYTIWVVLALAAWGVAAVYSAIAFLAATKGGGDSDPFLWRHIGKVAVAIVVMGGVSLVDYHVLARFSRWMLIGSLVLLAVVAVWGTVSGGAARWLAIGGISFQPSDLAKVALILYVGTLLARKQSYIESLSRAFLPVMLWTLATVVLIGMENLSTAALLLAACLLMCFVARVRTLHLAGLATIGLVLALVLLAFSPARAARVEQALGMQLFSHTEAQGVGDELREAYQPLQARIAIAGGGLVGVGPGKSVQRDFLPAPYNDFIFAIIAEEYGLIGALLILGMFVVLLFRGFLRIARHAPDPMGLFIGVGFTLMIVLSGFAHAGVSVGLLPVTGQPLPFVSYGGTSMLAMGAMTGILLNLSRQSR
jgi:cell division protein FtsW